jgi:integrase
MPIYNRNGIWHIQFDIRGRRFKRSTGRGTSRQEAKELEKKWRKEFLKQLEEESLGIITDKTFGEAILRWLDEDAPKSMYCHIRLVVPVLKDFPLKNIVAPTLAYKQKMIRDGLKPATINRRMAIVKRVLTKCYSEWDWLAQPLAKKITLLKENNERYFFLEPDQVHILAELCYQIREEYGDLILLAAYSGLRKSEIQNLRPSSFINGKIFLEKTKNKKARLVPVPDHIFPILEKLPIKFCERAFYDAFAKAREKIGMPDLHFHDLRHTYGSWLASEPSIPPTAIRDLMGHKTLAASNRYLHLRTKTLDDAVAMLPKPKK